MRESGDHLFKPACTHRNLVSRIYRAEESNTIFFWQANTPIRSSAKVVTSPQCATMSRYVTRYSISSVLIRLSYRSLAVENQVLLRVVTLEYISNCLASCSLLTEKKKKRKNKSINLLRWNVTHVENFFLKIATFSQFSVYLGKTR